LAPGTTWNTNNAVQYEFGAYTLDGARFELRRAGVVIAVQRRVLDTILCLIENRGRVVTKDELVSGPWQGATVTDAALNRAVMLARRAVQQERADPSCIQTIRGRGFMWTAPVRSIVGNAPASGAADREGSLARSEAGGAALPTEAQSAEPAAIASTANDSQPASERLSGGPDIALTDRKLRVQCVVLVGRSPTRSPELVDSLLSMLPPPRELAWKSDLKGGASPAEGNRRARVDHLADDSMVITLPVGLSLTDQVAASARYASSLRVLLSDAPMVICTGRAFTSGSVPSGEVIERASKLLQGSPPGSIRLDTTTADLLTAQFLIEGDGEERYLTGPRTLEDVPRTVLGKTVPCLGRDRELKLLQDIFAGVVEESEARAVLLTAPAGGGKTRLRQELVKRLEGRQASVEILLARADSLRAESPFGLLAALVRAAAGVFGGDSLELRRQKLRGRVSRRVSSDKAPRVAVFLGELAGIPFADAESAAIRAARQDARLMGEQMRAAWLDWIEAECTAEPVLLMLEDLHWSDLPSVQLVDAALRTLRETRLMVLALARPEVTTRFAHLWEARGLETFALSPLTRRVCETIVLEVLGEDAARNLVARVVEQADGNPFFLEELVRGIAVGQTDLPETVVGMVQTRLDALGGGAARLLRAASVFGETFDSRAVRLLLGHVETRELESTLHSLVEREIIVPRHAGRTHEYVFRHSIMRDASYATLTGGDRVLGHRLAGQWLEGRGERDAMVLAEHFDRGEDRERAAVWFARAAGQAVQGGEFAAAILRAERSIACGATGETLSEASRIEAYARYSRGELPGALASVRRAIEHAVEGTPHWFHAVRDIVVPLAEQDLTDEIAFWGKKAHDVVADTPLAAEAQVACLAWCGGGLTQSGLPTLGCALLERAESMLATIPKPDAWVLLRLHHAKGIRYGQNGDVMRALEQFEIALEACEQAGDTQAACISRGELAVCFVDVGDYHRAESLIRKTLTDAKERSLVSVETFTLPDLAEVLIELGRLDEAREVLEQVLLLAKEQNNTWSLALTSRNFSTLAFVSGDFVAAELHARSAAEAVSQAPAPRAAALAALARALLAQGRNTEALESAQEASSVLDALGSSRYSESLVRLMIAETRMAVGDEVGARSAIGAARDSLLQRAEHITDALVRESFLTRVRNNSRTLQLAREWAAGPAT
jgi:DNA-binding winged helix-turn-helix (wHTH) protein/tetratricopeptide (TPR) repeat protein